MIIQEAVYLSIISYNFLDLFISETTYSLFILYTISFLLAWLA